MILRCPGLAPTELDTTRKGDKTVNHFDIETYMTENVPKIVLRVLAVNHRFYWILWCDSVTDSTGKSQQLKSL